MNEEPIDFSGEGTSVICLDLTREKKTSADEGPHDGRSADYVRSELWWWLNSTAFLYAVAGIYTSYMGLGLKTAADLNRRMTSGRRSYPAPAVVLSAWLRSHGYERKEFHDEMTRRKFHSEKKPPEELVYADELRWIEDNVMWFVENAKEALAMEIDKHSAPPKLRSEIRKLKTKTREVVRIVEIWYNSVGKVRALSSSWPERTRALLAKESSDDDHPHPGSLSGSVS